MYRAEGPAEVARARKPHLAAMAATGREPAPDRKVTAAALQPPLPDPARHGQALVVEELLQGAQGHVIAAAISR